MTFPPIAAAGPRPASLHDLFETAAPEPAGLYAVMDQFPHRILVKDIHSNYVWANRCFAEEVGVAEPRQLVGRSDFDFLPREMAERNRADDLRVMRERTKLTFETSCLQDGRQRWLETVKSPVLDEAGQVAGVLVLFNDITDKKHDAAEAERHAWALQAMSRCNHALVQAETEAALLQGVCDAVVSDDRYLLTLICWARDDEEKSLDVVAFAGQAVDYTNGLKASWGDGPLGQGPTGTCIRIGKTVHNRNILHSSLFLPWQERARRNNLHSAISVPLKEGERAVGAMVVFAGVDNAFGDNEVRLFEELAGNLCVGVRSRRTQIAYDASLRDAAFQAKALEKALEDALEAIASVLEQRDPYTAGHQKHVADLAVMIGIELGLQTERLRGLYLSGVVHDLGKIQVPAELLTKPARLNPVEFALVKQHPEVGYTILKNIDFPWPIADIIRQHHEYLDGSGYPHGLSGNQILYEARILTVADIVESMSSDRPYRPALGIEQAIAEITRMRDAKLDPEIVDACIRVLRRGDFVPYLLSREG